MERWKQWIILNKTGQESLFFLYHYHGIMGLPWNHRFVFFWWSVENSWLSSAKLSWLSSTKLDRIHFSSCTITLESWVYLGIIGLFSSDGALKTADYPQQDWRGITFLLVRISSCTITLESWVCLEIIGLFSSDGVLKTFCMHFPGIIGQNS